MKIKRGPNFAGLDTVILFPIQTKREPSKWGSKTPEKSVLVRVSFSAIVVFRPGLVLPPAGLAGVNFVFAV